MNSTITISNRDLFEVENARNLNVEEVARTFVPTQAFWTLMSSKHHIILGARGSGKTALAKMLSHEHLAILDDNRAKDVISDASYIGIYVPMKLEWVSGLKNKPWSTDSEKEELFQWRLNIASCLSLLATLSSCLRTYFPEEKERVLTEYNLASKLGADWMGIGEGRITTLSQLESRIRRKEYTRQQELARTRAMLNGEAELAIAGFEFATDLFEPLKHGIFLAEETLNFTHNPNWLLCLDEAEFLDVDHHRILNSYLRGYTGNIFLKITTMPYQHHTLSTNTGASLDEGHDFSYVYIDQDPVVDIDSEENESVRAEGYNFARKLFEKRADTSRTDAYSRVTLERLLGDSVLLEPKNRSVIEPQDMHQKVEQHCDEKTIARSARLLDRIEKAGDEDERKRAINHYNDQVARKLRSAILLREAVQGEIGNNKASIYCGMHLLVRCGDGNPRRLVRLFNLLFKKSEWKGAARSKRPIIESKEQTAILSKFSSSTLERIQAEKDVGPDLHEFLNLIGYGFKTLLHRQRLSTDLALTFHLDRRSYERYREVVQRGVGLGLIYPELPTESRLDLPSGQQKFRLAFILAPTFRLLPRSGKSRSLTSLKRMFHGGKDDTTSPSLFSGDDV